MKKNLQLLLSLVTFVLFAVSAKAQITIDVDMTSKVDVTDKAWGGAYCATQFAPAITTDDGRTVQMVENYQTNVDATGDLLKQTVQGLPAGTYRVVLYGNAFYTAGRGFDSDVEDGQMDVAYLFAETSVDRYKNYIPARIATETSENSTVTLDDVVVGENGELTIGLGKDQAGTNWHTVQIKGVTALVNADEALASTVAEAEAINEEDVPANVYQALVDAIAANNKTYATADEYKAAIAAINEAIATAKAFAVAKPVIEAMTELVESTNVYTTKAYEEYYGQWVKKYENGTLTYEEAQALENPTSITGWHQANKFDDLLLSAWTIGGEQAKDYDKDLYINTWSVEGNTDGSEFYTPFFEYWTNDANSLGANELTATLTELVPGNYTVTAWVRVRTKNGVDAADATGITLIANDGEAVDVTEGEKVGATQFNIGEYTANATVAKDGKLTITFNVAEDNNISWLSFKNVKYTLVEGGSESEDDNLTSDMFHEWDAEGNITGSVPGIHFTNKIGEEVWQGAVVYGNSRVEENAYADLTEYEKMILTVQSGTPRLVFNVKGATEKIEIKGEGEYTKIDGKTWTIDLAKITSNEGFAHLNVIKEAKWTGTVTISSIVLKKAETLEETYARAIKTIQDGNYYQIYSSVNGTDYYLKADGKLTTDKEEAYNFEFQAVQASGTLYETGWNLGTHFSNPKLSNGSTGDIQNVGGIRTDNSQNRDNWERQVFFLNNSGEYAVRSTNATGEEWGANTYWTVLTESELPEAGHALTPNYVWQLKDVTAESILAVAEAVVEAKAGVGEGLFEISEEAYNTYAAAVAAAKAIITAENATAEEIAKAIEDLKVASEAYAAAPRNTPIAGQAYIVANATAEGNLSVGNETVTIEEGASVYFTAVEGGYAVSNENGEYIFKTSDNTWTLSTTSDLASAYVLTVNVVEGGYTLQGARGLLGTDNVGAGSTVYANKAIGNNGLWTITASEEKPEVAFKDTPLTQDMFKTWDGFDASAKVVGEAPYWDAAELGTTLGGGGVVYGSGNVTNTDYADITGANVLRIEGTSGLTLRVMFNRQADQSLVTLTPTIGNNGYVDVDLASEEMLAPYEYVHLNAIKINWGAEGAVTALILNPSVSSPQAPAAGDATGISGVDATSAVKNGKFLENNKIVIYRNGVKYNVNGAVIK